MEIHQDFSELLREFIAEGVRYLIVGGYAAGIHARPRMTKDIDLFVARDVDNAARLYRALARFGAPLEGIGENDFTSDDLIYQMGRPPVRIEIAGMNVDVIGREELIKNKRSVGRPQDLADVDAIMKYSR